MTHRIETRIPGTRFSAVPLRPTRSDERHDADEAESEADAGTGDATEGAEVILEPQPPRQREGLVVSRELLEDEAGHHIDLRG